MKLTLAALISAFVIGMCVGVSIVHAEGAEPNPLPYCDDISRQEGVCK